MVTCAVLWASVHDKSRGVEQSVARRAHNPKVEGSSPSSATNADVAQSVERILGKDKVTSSILVISSSGGVAQLARAFGSYPTGHVFESHLRYQKTPPEIPEEFFIIFNSYNLLVFCFC